MGGLVNSHATDHGGQRRRMIGDYSAERELGRGAFGVVYLGRSQRLDRPVAIKLMLDPDLDDPEARERFLLEARVAARLHAPGIVRVHDLGEDQGRPFFVMDYCPGETLAERIKREPLSPDEAARTVAQLARSMVAAHDQGVLHRDLKPANVILDRDSRRPLITDFGLARDRSLLRSMTRTGDVLGTPSYMSPEQIRGEKQLDARTDLYALGAILYCCLTGRPPLQGRNFFELSQLVQQVVPAPPSQARAGLPPALDAICAQALAKEPGERQRDCGELAEQLEAFLAGDDVVAAAPAAPRWIGPAIGALLLAAGGLTALALVRRAEPTPVEPASAEQPPDDPAQRPPEPGPSASPASSRPAVATPASEVELEQLLGRAEQQRVQQRPYAEVAATLEAALRGAQALGSPSWTDRVLLARAELDLARGRFAAARGIGELGTPRALVLEALVYLSDDDEVRAARAMRSLPADGGGEDARQARLIQEIVETRATPWGRRRERYHRLRETLLDEIPRGADATLLALAAEILGYRDPERRAAWLEQAEALAPDDAAVHWLPLEGLRRHLERAIERPERLAERRGFPVTPEEIEAVESRLAHAQRRFLELTEGAPSPLRAEVLANRGARLARDDPQAGLALLEAALETEPWDLETRFQAGRTALRLGEPAAAADHWRRAWAASPSLAGRYTSLVDPSEAQILAAQTGQRIPTLGDLLRGEEANAFAQAIRRDDLLTPLLEPLTQAERGALRDFMLDAVQGHPWAVCAEKLPAVDQVTTPAGALLMARVCLGRGAHTLTRRWLDHAEQLGVPELDRLALEVPLARRQGQTAEAGELCARGIELDPRGPTGWVLRGERAVWNHDYDGAAEAAERALALDPTHWAALDLRVVGHALRDPEAALGYAAAARLVHGDLTQRATLGRALAEVRRIETGRSPWIPGLPIALLAARCQAGYELRVAADALTRLLERTWDPELAGQCDGLIDESLRREPDVALTHVLKARLLRVGGQADEAAARYARARELDPSLPPELR